MGKNEEKPAIRFQGFADPWEQRKLGDIFEEYSEKSHPELPALTIIQGGGTIRRDESDRSLQYDKASLSNYKMVNEGDFIVHLRSFEGGLEKATTLGIISPAYHTFHGKGTDSRFYYSYFRSPNFIDQDLKPHVYGIRDGRSIDIEGMKTIEIPWTCFAEQKAIGDYIDVLDNLITLHQRKYDKLVNVKKSMLEKMFPRDGANAPEIRFAGFTDPWEQRKFSELAEIRRGLTYKPSDICEDGIRVLRSSNINEDSFVIGKDDVFVRQEAINIPYAQAGDILITSANGSSRLVGKHAIIDGIADNSTVHGGFMLLASAKNPQFVNASMSSSWYAKFINIFVAGGNGAIGNLNKNNLDEQSVLVPSEPEQQQIGMFFQNLDNLITLHQRKLEKLNSIKKSMLEKMFI